MFRMKSPLQMVIIGHIALQEEVNERIHSSFSEIAGAGWYCAIGAACVAERGSVGIVSIVGNDHPDILHRLQSMGIDTQGIYVDKKKNTAQFHVVEKDGNRIFTAHFNAAEKPFVEHFPNNYWKARHIHIATCPPKQQIEWIQFLRSHAQAPMTISVDLFEQYVRDNPEETEQVIHLADLVFLNEEEYAFLDHKHTLEKKPYILKRGVEGAEYKNNEEHIVVSAPNVVCVSTSGAGEIVASIFLMRTLQQKSIKEALTEAVEYASASVKQKGVEHLLLLHDIHHSS